MPSSRRGTLSKSILIPASPLADISEQEQVIPAAPISCIPTNQGFRANSNEASIRSFSVKGSPTCTFDRLDSVSSVSSIEANVAPWIPSRPVLLPTRNTGFPVPVAIALATCFVFTTPNDMAFTRQFPE